MAPRDRSQVHDAERPTPWRDELPDLAVFPDIQVAPPRAFYANNRLVDGGPVLPDFAARATVRFCSRDKLIDRNPIPIARPRPVVGDFVWGGFATGRFGQFIVEHASRLLLSIR